MHVVVVINFYLFSFIDPKGAPLCSVQEKECVDYSRSKKYLVIVSNLMMAEKCCVLIY